MNALIRPPKLTKQQFLPGCFLWIARLFLKVMLVCTVHGYVFILHALDSGFQTPPVPFHSKHDTRWGKQTQNHVARAFFLSPGQCRWTTWRSCRLRNRPQCCPPPAHPDVARGCSHRPARVMTSQPDAVVSWLRQLCSPRLDHGKVPRAQVRLDRVEAAGKLLCWREQWPGSTSGGGSGAHRPRAVTAQVPRSDERGDLTARSVAMKSQLVSAQSPACDGLVLPNIASEAGAGEASDEVHAHANSRGQRLYEVHARAGF